MAGSGPLLVLTPGARGTGATFQPLAQHLALHFSVLTYDQRGYTGSSLGGPQDISRRLETCADDVALLVQRASNPSQSGR